MQLRHGKNKTQTCGVTEKKYEIDSRCLTVKFAYNTQLANSTIRDRNPAIWWITVGFTPEL